MKWSIVGSAREVCGSKRVGGGGGKLRELVVKQYSGERGGVRGEG